MCRRYDYEGFLNGESKCPNIFLSSKGDDDILNPDYKKWNLIDQNLASTLYSTISTSILPYVLALNTCVEIWSTIEKRLLSTNRARLQQIKNELHNLTMGNMSMAQYLLEIKMRVDLLVAAGCPIEIEDIIYYTLNRLSPSYQGFKVEICTNLQLVSLDDLYSLLCCEETLLQDEENHLEASHLQNMALLTTRSKGNAKNSSKG